MIKKLIVVILAVIACVSCDKEVRVKKYSAEIVTSQCNVKISFYGDGIARVEKYPLGQDCPQNYSFSVTAKPQKVDFNVEKNDSVITVISPVIRLEVCLNDGNVRFFTADGDNLLSEKPESFIMTAFNDGPRASHSVSQSYCLEDSEAVYGLGQHQQGHMNMRGTKVELRQVNMEVAIPLMHSVKGYAIYWDNPSKSVFDDTSDCMTFTSQVGDKLDCYFMYGGNADGVIAAIRTLTGQAPMNPLWVFGFNQSRERYASAEQLVGIVQKYRELEVPLDGIIQDWRYWGDNNYWNALEFRDSGYPDPEKMLSDIHALNAHCMISVWPSFGPDAEVYKELQEKGLLLTHDSFPPNEGSRNYNSFDPQAREIYWRHMTEGLYSKGIDAWWLDATEPEVQHSVEADFDFMTPYGTYRSLFNSYPIASVGGVYDAQKAQDRSKRVMILTRSASFGQQRYASHVWSGDVVSDWEVLARQIPAALNFTSCGIPYWNSDIGGFFPHQYPGGYENPEFAKLYTRWLQFAAFTGMMRSHGTGTPREIFRFGSKGDLNYDVQEYFINLRYRLLPYIYSASACVSFNAGTLMRALYMDWADDSRVWDISDEYMFGRSLLVAPVVTEDDAREVYLPEGKWYDFFDNTLYEGAQSLELSVPMTKMPLFVRAGSILPVGPSVQYAEEKKWDSLQIRIYPGADGSFGLYEDEGDNYNYEDGASSLIPFRWNDADHTLTIGQRSGAFEGMLSERDFRIVIAGEGKASGIDNESFDKIVHYEGEEIIIKL